MQGLATVSKGTAEFLADGERLQPKVAQLSPNNPANMASFRNHISDMPMDSCIGRCGWFDMKSNLIF